MSLPVEFLAGAHAELQAIFNRCEDYQDGFGVEFMTAVDAYLEGIRDFSYNSYRTDTDRPLKGMLVAASVASL
jgi:hypothetical protein